MSAAKTTFREATAADMPGIARVRTSVRENLLTMEQLRERGITNESVAASFLGNSKGWVAERNGEIVAFAIADRASASLFALFVLPSCERQGVGSHLHELAVQWLRANAVTRLAHHRLRYLGCPLLRAPRLGRKGSGGARRYPLRVGPPIS
jgi:GNAT superfamily N-acetyltransferase